MCIMSSNISLLSFFSYRNVTKLLSILLSFGHPSSLQTLNMIVIYYAMITQHLWSALVTFQIISSMGSN